MREIVIARDFTTFPGGRYIVNGKGSGELFRKEFLIPVLEKSDRARVHLDGAVGYPSSFLEEAFGGLVRLGYSADQIRRAFTIEAGPSYAPYARLIWDYVDKAAGHQKASA